MSHVTKKARRVRLEIAKIRTSAEKERKRQKAEHVLVGKAIDGVNNILKMAISKKEEKLKDIENHFENMEKERLEKLQSDRAEKLSTYVDNAEDMKLSEMDDDVWDIILAKKKSDYEDRKEAEEKETLAKRVAETTPLPEQIQEPLKTLNGGGETNGEKISSLVSDLTELKTRYNFVGKEHRDKMRTAAFMIDNITDFLNRG